MGKDLVIPEKIAIEVLQNIFISENFDLLLTTGIKVDVLELFKRTWHFVWMNFNKSLIIGNSPFVYSKSNKHLADESNAI